MFKIEKHQNADRRIVLRTTDELAEYVFKLAKEKNVSVNNLLLSCIEYALKNFNEDDKKKN